MDDETAPSDIEKIFASGRRSRSNSLAQQKFSSRSEGNAIQQEKPVKMPGRLSLSAQGDKKMQQEPRLSLSAQGNKKIQQEQAEKNDFRPIPKPRSKPPPAASNRNLQNAAPSEGLVPGSLIEENEIAPVHVYNDAVQKGNETKNESTLKSSNDYSEEQFKNDDVQSAPNPDDQEEGLHQPEQNIQSEMPTYDGNEDILSSPSFASPTLPIEQPPSAETHPKNRTTDDRPDQNTTTVQQNSSRAQLVQPGAPYGTKSKVIYSRNKQKDNGVPITERTKLRDQLFDSEERNRILRQRLDKLSMKSEQLIDENIAIKRQLEQGLQTDHLINSLDQIGCLPPMLMPVLWAPWDPQQNLNADIDSLAAKAKALESALIAAASVPQSHYDQFARPSFRQTPSTERSQRRPATAGATRRSSFTNAKQQSSNEPLVPPLQLALTDRSVVSSQTKPPRATNPPRASSGSTQWRSGRPRSSESLLRESQKNGKRPRTSSAAGRPPPRPSSVGPSQRAVADDLLESGLSVSKKPVFPGQQSTRAIAPFQPNNYLDVQPGYEAKFIRQNGLLDQGIIRYVGVLPNKKEPYMGIELHLPNGKHDGVYRGRRYFNCSPHAGIFVPHSKIITVWKST
uniref:CAP-Gly domain-containing protein n=1 Tax=Plectus sambesii TaxID=2011161 RepID=A0A914VM67_9BILA